jgi:hypothetical protein
LIFLSIEYAFSGDQIFEENFPPERLKAWEATLKGGYFACLVDDGKDTGTFSTSGLSLNNLQIKFTEAFTTGYDGTSQIELGNSLWTILGLLLEAGFTACDEDGKKGTMKGLTFNDLNTFKDIFEAGEDKAEGGW